LAAAATEARIVMGTRAEVEVTVVEPPTAALDAAFAALDRVDRSMSLWKQSELTRLNREAEGRVSADIAAVLQAALDVAEDSGGAFDPTVEPLVRAGGGYGGVRRDVDESERRRLMALVGARHVHFDAGASTVRLDPGTALDFGGIAKGYAVDLALGALRAAGAESGLVDLGQSSVGAFGRGLVLDVRDPERTDGTPWARFEIPEGHVSTSAADQQPGHILDPHTGRAARRVLAATVIASRGMEADA